MIPSIVLLGNLLVDDVVHADGTTRMGQAGGALLYGALGATVACAGLIHDGVRKDLTPLVKRLLSDDRALQAGFDWKPCEVRQDQPDAEGITASFAVVGWGPEALLAATRADAEARLRQWYGSEGQR